VLPISAVLNLLIRLIRLIRLDQADRVPGGQHRELHRHNHVHNGGVSPADVSGTDLVNVHAPEVSALGMVGHHALKNAAASFRTPHPELRQSGSAEWWR